MRGDKAAGRNWYTLAAAGVMAAGREDAASSIGRLSSTAPHEGDLLSAPGGRAISLLRVGRGFISLGYPEEALPVLEQAMAEMQEDPPGLMERQSINLSLAEALAGVHPPGQHLDVETRARVQHLVDEGLALGRSGNILLTAASVLWTAGMKNEGLALNREALAKQPRMPEAHLALGAAYEELGYHYLALSVYREAVRLLPDDGRLLAELGMTTLRTNGPRQAIPILEQARTTETEDVSLLTSLGDAYLSVGRVEPAMRTYRTALSMVPDSHVLKLKIHRAAEARRTLS
jgi:Flp pilus assembly protein TadD